MVKMENLKCDNKAESDHPHVLTSYKSPVCLPHIFKLLNTNTIYNQTSFYQESKVILNKLLQRFHIIHICWNRFFCDVVLCSLILISGQTKNLLSKKEHFILCWGRCEKQPALKLW